MKINRNEILTRLLDSLWQKYIQRVSYAKTYAHLVQSKGGRVVNDHIAFRTFNTITGKQPHGIGGIWHILDAFDYKPSGNYTFTEKKLHAVHFQHPEPQFPKIFVSQLEVGELPKWAQDMINKHVKDTPYHLSETAVLDLLEINEKGELEEAAVNNLVRELTAYFSRPWGIPDQMVVEQLNEISQYAAWTLLHGNSVNHFTAFINYQNVADWPDLQTTCEALADSGVPMKTSIEGEKGSKLQQSSTQAVTEMVKVKKPDGAVGEIPWTYAYYELAERGYIDQNGEQILFSGFLGEQATHLFEMTKTN
ncbi:DUF1338 domain-containing protein [Mangrovibacterium diazotrophicum]|uniref:2-oxoadipate dioxygenase/decarboxylase n=1 Tax=Mangrovibacterium diazotrophicum TaxID=1261403 RepID=A0A419W6G8_9BACT|nr:DUF1338 domain-containing protein [Mangrovibacterium diazotrophicum]RKD91046.1 uncharacterized protein DUF1338 [Mangrovibacterium diazotrophicum]